MGKTTGNAGAVGKTGSVATTPVMNVTKNKDTGEVSRTFANEKETHIILVDPEKNNITALRDYSSVKLGSKQGNAEAAYNKMNDYRAVTSSVADGGAATYQKEQFDKKGVQFNEMEINIDGNSKKYLVGRCEGVVTNKGFDFDSVKPGEKVTPNDMGKQLIMMSAKQADAKQRNALTANGKSFQEAANISRANTVKRFDDVMKNGNAYSTNKDSVEFHSFENEKGEKYAPAIMKTPASMNPDVRKRIIERDGPDSPFIDQPNNTKTAAPKTAEAKANNPEAPKSSKTTEVIPEAKIFVGKDKNGNDFVSVHEDLSKAGADRFKSSEQPYIKEYSGESAKNFSKTFEDEKYKDKFKEMTIDGAQVKVMDVKNLPVTKSVNKEGKEYTQLNMRAEGVETEPATVKNVAEHLNNKNKCLETYLTGKDKEMSAEAKENKIAEIADRKRTENVTYKKDAITTTTEATKSGHISVTSSRFKAAENVPTAAASTDSPEKSMEK